MQRRRQLTQLAVLLSVVGVILIAAMVWGNYQYCKENPGGNDFLVHWMGTRSFLVNGLSPYSDETALKIQTMAYGRPAQPGEHELRVAYPLYSVIIFLPFAFIKDFILARAIWMTVSEIAIILLAVLTMRLSNWRPGLILMAVYLLFSVFWYHGLRALINGNAVILVALGLVGAFLAIRNGADGVAGVLLALTTIKPQVVLVVILFVLFWGLSNRRWDLIIWFIGSMILLVGMGMLLMPDWIVQNLREVLRYPGYNPPGTFGAALSVYLPAMGSRIANGVSIILGGVLLVEWWLARKAEARRFLWVACLTLVASQWIGIQTDPGNFIVLFPALILVFAIWEERLKRSGRLLTVIGLILAFFGEWGLFLASVRLVGGQPQQSPLMFFPFPFLMLILLYWVRWWAIRPSGLWYDKLFQQEHSSF